MMNITESDETEIYQTTIAVVPFWYYTIICVIMAFLGINGTLLNGFVILIFSTNHSVRTPYNAVVLNLVFVEFVLACVGVTLDVQAILQHGWVIGKNMCIISGV